MKNGMPLKLTVGVERKGKMFKANYEIVNTTQTPTEAVYIDPRAVTQMKITKNSKNETIYVSEFVNMNFSKYIYCVIIIFI